MNKVFVTKGEISLQNGGYLVITESKAPVFHTAFIQAQREAHYLVTLAKEAEGKDFVGKVAESFITLADKVANDLNAVAKVSYVAMPTEPKGDLREKLAKEALAFINFGKDSNKANQINTYLQKFNIINEFEEFGLYFDNDIVKLNGPIYTVEEITKAVTSLSDHLV
jgi:hypothetical protein